jgi:hypothetical protein
MGNGTSFDEIRNYLRPAHHHVALPKKISKGKLIAVKIGWRFHGTMGY